MGVQSGRHDNKRSSVSTSITTWGTLRNVAVMVFALVGTTGGSCDDRAASSCPPCGANQVCNEALSRCEVPCLVPRDADGDGSISTECGGDDCDDNDPNRFPGNSEVCDVENKDEDCDPTTFGERDADRDGYFDATCCNRQPNGSLLCGTDCNDANPAQHPGLVEICDLLDNDCNGLADDGATVALYADEDRDGHGAGPPVQGCSGAPGYSTLGNDCDDTSAAIKPGAFRCGAKYGEYELCGSDGKFTIDVCPLQRECRPQPGGFGVCL